MTEEYLDILDENGEQTGESRTYTEAHEKGLIHRTAHVWVLNSKKELLLQKRASDRRAYPNYWDISAAGHISAGESSLQGAKRELREELGIDLPDSMFKHIFTTEEHIILNNGTYVNNEFQDVFLVNLNQDYIDKIKFDEVEVAKIKWISITDFKEWIEGKGELLVPHEEEYSKLLKHINA